MKNRVADRILSVTAAILLILLGAGLAAASVVMLLFPGLFGVLPVHFGTVWLVGGIIGGLLFVFLGIAILRTAFRRRRTQGYVRIDSVNCVLDISLETVDQHLLNCLSNSYGQIGLLDHTVYALRNGVGVHLLIDLPMGVGIPAIVSGMKDEACRFISECTGLEVLEFSVQVSGTQNLPLLPASVQEPARQEESDFDRRLFAPEPEQPAAPEKEMQPDASTEDEQPIPVDAEPEQEPLPTDESTPDMTNESQTR